MKAYVNQSTIDNYSFGLCVWQVAKDGEEPYDHLEFDELEEIKITDEELRMLLDDLPDKMPDYFRVVIVAMTKYAPGDPHRLKML